jgi:hypothetical protein
MDGWVVKLASYLGNVGGSRERLEDLLSAKQLPVDIST